MLCERHFGDTEASRWLDTQLPSTDGGASGGTPARGRPAEAKQDDDAARLSPVDRSGVHGSPQVGRGGRFSSPLVSENGSCRGSSVAKEAVALTFRCKFHPQTNFCPVSLVVFLQIISLEKLSSSLISGLPVFDFVTMHDRRSGVWNKSLT